MFISKKKFEEEIAKAIQRKEEQTYIHRRIEDTERYLHERIERLERRVYELESMAKQPIVAEGVALPVGEVTTRLL